MKLYKNPIILNSDSDNTSDPFVTKYDGYYYHCYSNNSGIYITKADKLWEIGNQKPVQVYDSKKINASGNWWYAPELHCINGKWYIYAAPEYNNGIHVMTVLECDGNSPIGEYKNLGMIKGLENKWSIDGTVLTYRNELYFIWTTCSEMYISKMSDPCSLTGKTAVISKPEYPFETRVDRINEGPSVLYKGDKIHIVYSANDSKCDEYCLGLLTFQLGGDILDITNWTKSKNAVFEKTNEIFGPGHCSFTTVTENEKETDYIVYHANIESGSGWNGRNVFVQPFSWTDNGMPIFNKPEF